MSEKVEPVPVRLAERMDLWLGLAAIAAAMTLLFGLIPYGMGYGNVPASVFKAVYWMWINSPEWEHCMLVPAICGVLIYLKRQELAETPVRAEPLWGGLALLAAVGLYWLGYKLDIMQMSFLIMHFTLGALLLWFFGPRFFKHIFFVYVFLLFAWPMPFLDGALAFRLRIFMTELAHVFLNVIGIENLRVGTAIVSAPSFEFNIPQGQKFAVDIADPCSGIRSLFGLTMVAALYAYFMVNGLWRQLVVFASAIPLAVAGNFVRVLILTFGTLMFGSDFAIGTEADPSFFHMLSGYVVYLVALGGVALLGWMLQGGWRGVVAWWNNTRTSISHELKSPRPDGGETEEHETAEKRGTDRW